MQHPLFVFSIVLFSIISLSVCQNDVLFEWKSIDYLWKSPEHRKEAIESGNYNASVCVPYDVDRAPDGRIFVTVVTEPGVPASLTTVVRNPFNKRSPLLRPYPDWSWYNNNNGTCEGITSVYRVYIKCNYIFVLDCGQIGPGYNQVCPPQLLIFDLGTNKLVKRVEIPLEYANNKNGDGLLVTPVVYVPHKRCMCKSILEEAIVFMADVIGFGLVVWYAANSKFCRFESDSMKPTEADTIFDINGETFPLNDGILGLTLVHEHNHEHILHLWRRGRHSKEYLYYAPLAGASIYKTEILNLLKCPKNSTEFNEVGKLTGTLLNQTGPIASRGRAIFFSNIPQTSILVADNSKEINAVNNMATIMQNPVTLQFPSGLKITHCDELLILTNSLQRVYTGTLNLNETNFRVLRKCIGRHCTECDIRKGRRNYFDSCGRHRHWHLDSRSDSHSHSHSDEDAIIYTDDWVFEKITKL